MRANQALPDRGRADKGFRTELLRGAETYTRDRLGLPCALPSAGETVVATGHQPVWHHCGIWIKSLACSKLARSLKGAGVHVVLDHDIRSTTLTIPAVQPNGTWGSVPYDLAPGAPEVPLELQRPQDGAVGRFLKDVLRADSGQFCNTVWGERSLSETVWWDPSWNMGDVVTWLQGILSTTLGLADLAYLPVSRLSGTGAFADFLASVLTDPTRFAQCYNEVVAGSAHHRRGRPGNAICPLEVDHHRRQTELPFWLVRAGQGRTSLRVHADEKATVGLLTKAGEVGRLPTGAYSDTQQALQQLERSGWAIRPKAVSLTLFLRLYLADWFIHGVGGARYEAITDHLMHEFYCLPVRPYGMITCTALLPRCRWHEEPVDASLTQHRSHHLWHNPEVSFGEPGCWPAPVRYLVGEKRREVARAGDRAVPDDQRKAAWKSILAINQRLRDYARRQAAPGIETMTLTEDDQTSQRIRGSREYFFGLFPEEKLRKWMNSVVFS